MKNRFTTLDIICIIPELHELLKGFRVHQVYDVDNKTFLIRLKDSGHENENEISKLVLLIESGIRIHVSEYEWPKNTNVSSFAMKLRKHLRNKRIEYIKQVGIDRVVDIQFGINEAAYHIIVELYDRGNVLITDHQYMILNLLRFRKGTENDDVKLGVRDIYPLHRAVAEFQLPTSVEIGDIMDSAKPGDTLRRIFNPRVIFGPALLEHCFIEVGFPENFKVVRPEDIDLNKVEEALKIADNIMVAIPNDHTGFIIYKEESSTIQESENESKTVIRFTEFHPMLFNMHKTSSNLKYLGFGTFGKAVDIYFSSIEGQKIDQKALQQEKDALKKLENVKKDHEKRLQELALLQEADKNKATLIEMNHDLVERALLVIRSAIANQISWEEIKELIKEAQEQGDPVASAIRKLKFETNHFTMQLKDPFEEEQPMEELVDIDIDLTAFGNARKYYDQKRHAAKKEKKTLDASSKALKNAELKTQQTLKEVAIKTSITKARKVLWFEKFLWFISSENYLVIAGKDAAQNEYIVKRHLKKGDIYVHADLHGASSVMIQNHSPDIPIPPKTLEEAGVMAVCYSSAWENKFSSRSWWVHSHQVSKTAPTGEYLTLGAFMIRGKKNYLPAAQLVMGFGFLFRLSEDSVERHKDERKIKPLTEDAMIENDTEDVEIDIRGSEDENDDEEKFPDTQVRNVGGKKSPKDEDQLVEITGSQAPRVKFQHIKKRPDKKTSKKTEVKEDDQKKCDYKPNQLKRGQRFKLKKIKEKYKDQDEEERRMKLAILGSAPVKAMQDESQKKASSEKNEDKKSNEEPSEDEENPSKESGDKVPTPQSEEHQEKDSELKLELKPEMESSDGEDEEDDGEEEDPSSKKTQENLKLVNSLTGQPTPEDTLLFAIPIVAPYSALSNFKYRVKVMPGTNKRGKAGKTALQLFINDKTATQREKDLLKSCKDQEIARNLPNKVKITAVNLANFKKKR